MFRYPGYWLFRVGWFFWLDGCLVGWWVGWLVAFGWLDCGWDGWMVALMDGAASCNQSNSARNKDNLLVLHPAAAGAELCLAPRL